MLYSLVDPKNVVFCAHVQKLSNDLPTKMSLPGKAFVAPNVNTFVLLDSLNCEDSPQFFEYG